MLLSLPKGSRW